MSALLVLGIDTATWTAAVGVVRDGAVLGEAVHRESTSHTAHLPGLIERVLADVGSRIRDVDAVAVSIGPGSFTGLRIGLALAKGLVFAGGLSLVAVPTLEALAWVAEGEGGTYVCTALDARKREVYAALFRMGVNGPERQTADMALGPEALVERLPPGSVIVGDAVEVYGTLLGAGAALRPFATHHPRGGIVARLGWERLEAGEAAEPGPLEPVYVRAADAVLPGGASR